MALDLKSYNIGATPTLEGGELRYIKLELQKLQKVLESYRQALDTIAAHVGL